MSAKNEKKVREIQAWAAQNGWTKDRYGNWKKEEDGRQYRLKIQAVSVRYELKTTFGEWMLLSNAYLKDITITPDGKLMGLLME
jgi:hypothetical protein